VTWRQHFGAAPDYPIDAAWMNRVQQIVDWALDAGLYAIINLHHDGGGDVAAGAWIRTASTNYSGVIAEYKALWGQIAARFANYDDHLVFESMNEVGFDDLKVNGVNSQAAYDLLNKINSEFVTLVRASGGNNGQRHLLLAGYWTDITESVKGVVMPSDSRCILSIHYYTPSKFCIDGNPSTWGSASEVTTLKGLFAKLKTTFIDKGIPIILGEFGVIRTTEVASRIFWIEYVTKTAYDLGIAPYLWDNGTDGEFDRESLTWRTPGLLDAIKRAASEQNYTPSKG
jgi:endoglucanase